MIDNYDLYRMHEARQEDWLRKRPVCAMCGEPIQDEYAWELEDDEWLYCDDCKNQWLDDHRVDVDNYVEERTENVW